jgi:hypothetical protein
MTASGESWRDEMYGDENGTDPFWVPCESANGDFRDPIDAAQLVKGFIGSESFEDGLTVCLVRGLMEDRGTDGFCFHKHPDGPVPVWEVCCS